MPDKKEARERRRVERDIVRRRRFSLAEAIGRAGRSFLKGASPVPRQRQVALEAVQFVESRLPDPPGALLATLRRKIDTSGPVLAKQFDAPLEALEAILEGILRNDHALREFVRQVDVEWGRIYLERPHFQKPDQAADPEDLYTHDSVRGRLESLLEEVRAALS
jgi:hypothetical protein